MTTTQHSTSAFPVAVVSGQTPKTYATTQAQLEIWLSCQHSVDANCSYNEISTLEIRGGLDAARLREAIEKVVERNESLRSTFSSDGRSAIVHRDVRYDFEQHDWTQLDAENVRTETDRVLETEGTKPFDLVRGPLIRFVLQTISETHHRLTFTAHHIVLDGWSLAVFCRDLGHFYDHVSGEPTQPLPPADQYSRYADLMTEYAASEQRREDESFWKTMYQDGVPVLDTPIEFPRPKLQTFRSRRYDHRFSPELIERVRAIGARQGCSLFNTFWAAFCSYVGRITNSDDVCLGIPAAGQAAMGQHELIGFCVNTMPVRVTIDTSQSFETYLRSTRSVLLDSFEHQRVSFGELVRLLAPPRDPSRPPLASISINLDPTLNTSEIGFSGLEVDVRVEPRCFEKFEWFINGIIQTDKSIELQIQFNTDLYSRDAMQFYFEGFQTYLEAIVEDATRALDTYPLMSIDQRQRVIVDWNRSESDYPQESTLHEEFSRQARETPDRVAVQFADRSLTYLELDRRSNQIARHLQSNGVRPGELVGICVERSDEMLVMLFGILKSGAGYVPLDPAYPSDRLAYMCDHSGLKLIVTQSGLRDRVEEFDKPLVEIDSRQTEIERLDDTPLPSAAQASDVCYVIYTSGSTGKPKGVQVPHGAVVNFLYSMREQPGFTADDSVLAVTTLSFDIAVLELYLPTLSGGRVVILDTRSAGNGAKLIEAIDTHKITLLQATPATWRLLLQSDWTGRRGLKALCGGEPMPSDLVGPLLSRCDQLWNMYGPTETTVWSAIFQIVDADAPILIGKPIGNTQLYVLDARGQEVPVGCEGEVYIGGAGVTLGYRNRPDLTDERFVKNRYRNPFANYVSDRLYRTGDIAKFRFDGNLEFLRRNDKQVKVRGFRIELGEIERNLDSHPAVRQNVVVVREDSPGDVRLVAYLIADGGRDVASAELREHLRRSVPGYMVPQHFVMLERMPQTDNGKIDYKQLPAPGAEPTSEPNKRSKAFSSPAESYLFQLCAELIQHDDIELDDTFFDIGGHSLLVMQLIARLEADTGIKFGPQDFLILTLKQLADKIGPTWQPDSVNDSTSQESQSKSADEESVTGVQRLSRDEALGRLEGFWE